jgi:hypothetical protein
MSDHDDLEMRFWAGCGSTFGEESKQRVYLREMGFAEHHVWHAGGFAWDAGGRSIIDIGGGPVSVLLKMENRIIQKCVVADPGDYPDWVVDRYYAAGIGFMPERGEDLEFADGDLVGYRVANATPTICAGGFDVALIYNCLQHVDSPEKIIANARALAKDLRMFEWIGIPAHEGHPHELSQEKLEGWTGRKGVVKEFRGENGCFGKAWILGGG